MTFFIIFGVVVLLAIASAVAKSKKTKQIAQRVSIEWGTSDVFVSPEDQSFIALDFPGQRVVLNSGNYQAAYAFVQIASVEIVESGITLTQTNRGSQVLGAVVGGVALGGVGALVGGLSGSSRSRSRLKNLSLKLIVDDPKHPVYSIVFLKTTNKKGLDPDGLVAKPALESIEKLHGQCIVAMRQSAVPSVTVHQSSGPPLQELDRLWDLKTRGVLSEEEFDEQKTLLLGRSSGALPAPTVAPPELSQSVTLISCGNKIEAIKAIRRLRPDMDLRDAKKMVDIFPSVLYRNLSPDAAESIRQQLRLAGVGVRAN